MKFLLNIATLIGLILCISCHPKSNMPELNLLLLDSSTVFNTKDIPAGKPSLLIFFSPDCEHCQTETFDLLKNIDSLKEINFYFITTDPFQRMEVFNRYFQLQKYANITLGRDYKYSFVSNFKQAIPPYTVLYDKYKYARVVISGQVLASQIISYINQL